MDQINKAKNKVQLVNFSITATETVTMLMTMMSLDKWIGWGDIE